MVLFCPRITRIYTKNRITQGQGEYMFTMNELKEKQSRMHFVPLKARKNENSLIRFAE
jgi:hypothetical protein